MERRPVAVAARQRHRRGLADVPDAERIDEPLQRNLAPCRDGGKQIAHRGLAETFHLLQAVFCRLSRCARSQRENSAGFFTQSLLVEQLDLLLAETVDIEGAAGDEVLEMLHRLVRAGELAGAAPDRALFAGRRRLAHHLGMQRTRAFFRETDIFLHHAALSGTTPRTCGMTSPARWMRHRIADAHVEPLDLVGIVQGRVLHHDAADGDRFSFATGVSAPVRPTWISMSFSTVVAFSAGNLWAIAQRGLRDT